MDALTALHSRTSVPRVSGPAPSEAAVQALFQAALRAPDHGQLRPWRFLRIEGDSLQRLADLFGASALAENPGLSEEEVQSARSKALGQPRACGAGNSRPDFLGFGRSPRGGHHLKP